MPTRRGPGHAQQIALHRDTTDHRDRLAVADSRCDAGAWRWRLSTLALSALVAACSNLPLAQRPPFVDHAVIASYLVPADGRIALPHSDRAVLVQELRSTPPPLREEFDPAGRRWFVFTAGSEITVFARLRCHADGDRPPAPLASLLPGARDVTPLPRP